MYVRVLLVASPEKSSGTENVTRAAKTSQDERLSAKELDKSFASGHLPHSTGSAEGGFPGPRAILERRAVRSGGVSPTWSAQPRSSWPSRQLWPATWAWTCQRQRKLMCPATVGHRSAPHPPSGADRSPGMAWHSMAWGCPAVASAWSVTLVAVRNASCQAQPHKELPPQL